MALKQGTVKRLLEIRDNADKARKRIQRGRDLEQWHFNRRIEGTGGALSEEELAILRVDRERRTLHDLDSICGLVNQIGETEGEELAKVLKEISLKEL